MGKFINKNNIELNQDVLLWSGSHSGYTHEVVLNDNPLKFKELILILNNAAVFMPIINGNIVSGGVVNNYKVTNVGISNYNSATKTLKIATAMWTNSSINEGALLEKIYGRY